MSGERRRYRVVANRKPTVDRQNSEDELTRNWNGQTRTFEAGGTFEMVRECPHVESCGTESAFTLAGRKR